MELKINCNAFVKLKNFLGILNIKSEVKEYSYHDETLEGKLLINGAFYDSATIAKEATPFSEEIPFIVVFKSNDNLIDAIKCENFEYYEVAGRGIETEFDIVVNYHKEEERLIDETNAKGDLRRLGEGDIEEGKDIAIDLDDVEEDTIIDFDVDNKVRESVGQNAKEQSKNQLVENNEDAIDKDGNDEENLRLENDDSEDDDLNEVNKVIENEAIKTMVTSKIDIILKAKMEGKTDNLPTEMIVLRTTKKNPVKICYYDNDSQLDQLCSKYDISIEKVLNEKKKNTDIRRIIIGID